MTEIKDGGFLEGIKDFFAEQARREEERMLWEAQVQREAAKMMPTEAQAAWGAAQFAPGMASLDLSGGMVIPPPEGLKLQDLPAYMLDGEKMLSAAENWERGGWGYLEAIAQGLGSLGDMFYAAGPVGGVVGSVFKAPGVAGKIAKAALSARKVGKGKDIDQGIGALPRGADEGIAPLDVPTPTRPGATPIPETFDRSEIFSLDRIGSIVSWLKHKAYTRPSLHLTNTIRKLRTRDADDLGRVNFPEHVPTPRELIRPTTRGRGGRIPGAPAHVKTPADEQIIIDNYLSEAELGAAGAFWYSTTARRINRDVGNVGGARPGAADRLAAAIGELSPRATLEANRLAQVRAFNQHATGLPVAAGMAPRNRAVQGILDTGTFAAENALKVGPFSMSVRGLSVPRGVHDVRDINSWGFGDVQATGEANHRWMDRMQDQAVELANERKLAGRGDWTHEQLQAARLVKHKADDMGVDVAALTDDFGPADQWLAANIFSEGAPSKELIKAGVLSDADVRTYTAMHQNLFTNPQGQDVLAHQLGLLSPDSTRFVGEWDGAFNPNIVTRIMADPAKGADVISEWSQEAIAFHGGLRGLLGGQADVAVSFLRKPKLVGDTNAYRIPFDRVVTEADIASYKRAAQKALREGDVPGDVVVNFRNDKELELTWLPPFEKKDPGYDRWKSLNDNAESALLIKAKNRTPEQKIAVRELKAVEETFRNSIEGITDGRGIPARNSGGLLTYEDRFNPIAWMEKLQNPLMRSKVEGMLPRIAADIERDIAKLPLTDTGQEIYQRTITLIKEGGLAAVENAVKQGILPAAVIGALLLGANQAPQQPFSLQDLGQPRT